MISRTTPQPQFKIKGGCGEGALVTYPPHYHPTSYAFRVYFLKSSTSALRSQGFVKTTKMGLTRVIYRCALLGLSIRLQRWALLGSYWATLGHIELDWAILGQIGQIGPEGIILNQIGPDWASRAQESPGDPRRVQECPEEPRRAQESPEEPSRAQESPM